MSHKLGYVLGSEVTVFTGIRIAVQGAPVPVGKRGDIRPLALWVASVLSGRALPGAAPGGGPSGPGALRGRGLGTGAGQHHGLHRDHTRGGGLDFLLLAMMTVVLSDQWATAPPAGVSQRLPTAP